MTGEERRGLLRDATDEDDWAWRRRIRANPTTRPIYRGVVLVVGLVLILGGLVLVPLPGPGWLIVILGIAVWASEFEPAARLLEVVKSRVRSWDAWIKAQARWVQALVAVLTVLFVTTVVWLVLRVMGVPSLVPDGITSWLQLHAGL